MVVCVCERYVNVCDDVNAILHMVGSERVLCVHLLSSPCLERKDLLKP